jgi:protein-S-isoprenylcysteine O-methyltransferase Ste14
MPVHLISFSYNYDLLIIKTNIGFLDVFLFFYIAQINKMTIKVNMNLVFITNLKAFFLFFIQYLSLVLLIVTGPVFPGSLLLMIFYFAGWILGIWSILAMGFCNINAGPDPLPEGQLVSRGPYAVIRHPMYAAILLVFIPLFLDHFTIPRLLIMMLLIINLLMKISYEEKQMNLSYCKKYREYSAGTWQLIPYVL